MGTFARDTEFADRYKILGLLGVGGMGQVYRALYLPLQKEVALKVLAGKSVADADLRFEREARIIAKLEHPSCVRIFDYGTYYKSRYIAMELLEGPSLHAALREEGAFSTTRAIAITRHLLSALIHAHGQGVLHRDIKPENIMLVTRGIPRTVLIDFGLAKLRDDAALTGSGLVLGSPSYIAPERLLGRPHDVRTDLYSLGVVLYEMLAGTRPFHGSNAEEIMNAALTRPHRPLRAIRSDVSPALEELVRCALAKDPERRFADGEAMLAALDDLPAAELLPTEPRATVVSHAEHTAHDEQASTMTDLLLARTSIFARFWSWLRYGRWRWRRRVSYSQH